MIAVRHFFNKYKIKKQKIIKRSGSQLIFAVSITISITKDIVIFKSSHDVHEFLTDDYKPLTNFQTGSENEGFSALESGKLNWFLSLKEPKHIVTCQIDQGQYQKFVCCEDLNKLEEFKKTIAQQVALNSLFDDFRPNFRFSIYRQRLSSALKLELTSLLQAIEIDQAVPEILAYFFCDEYLVS